MNQKRATQVSPLQRVRTQTEIGYARPTVRVIVDPTRGFVALGWGLTAGTLLTPALVWGLSQFIHVNPAAIGSWMAMLTLGWFWWTIRLIYLVNRGAERFWLWGVVWATFMILLLTFPLLAWLTYFSD